ncbi:MAG: magnesium transporter [Pseudomonadales bacterium]|jgi:magnesium transporter|nr:magnesium transporter [Pseudomonadales bacterium]
MTLVADLHRSYLTRHPAAAARTLERERDEAVRALLAEFDQGDAAMLVPVLDRVSPIRARALFEQLPADVREAVLAEAGPRLAVILLGHLSDADRDAVLSELPEGVRRELLRLLAFPEESAGRLMDRVFDSMRPATTVAEALEQLRGSRVKRARSVFVIDDDGRLVGRADMQDLAIAELDATLGELMLEPEGAITVTAPRDEIVERLEEARLDALPVVDLDYRLIGVVRYASLFRAVEAEASVDLQTMVGASADERALSSPVFAVRRRLPWLHINLLTAFLAAAVVGLFENLIAQFTALAVLLPVVAGQSGNAGSQALAVTIRGLALREIGIREWRAVLGKEVLTGLINGIVLAVVCGIGVWVWSGTPGLGLVIAVAMVLSVAAAGIAGALVPIVLTRVGQDPATASSIILTTVTDVAGFFSFLGTATALSSML